ncbi:MAG: hypothetical protein ACJZ4O_01315 [Pelagibacteraceae bacterium]
MSNEVFKENNQFINFLNKYKKKLILSLSLILIVILSYYLILYYKNQQNILVSNKYNEAIILIENNEINSGKLILNEIIEKKDSFYSPLALYLLIENNMEKNPEVVSNFFDEIISIKNLDKESRNLIILKKSIYISNYFKEDELLKSLKPLLDSESVWRNKALDLIAEFYKNIGNNQKYKEYLNLQNKN